MQGSALMAQSWSHRLCHSLTYSMDGTDHILSVTVHRY